VRDLGLVPKFMLTHRHDPSECRVAFAAWRGYESPLRHGGTLASCASVDGDHRHHIWWQVDAADVETAVALLPPFVAERTEVSPIAEVSIP
jgi:hypothetical protein